MACFDVTPPESTCDSIRATIVAATRPVSQGAALFNRPSASRHALHFSTGVHNPIAHAKLGAPEESDVVSHDAIRQCGVPERAHENTAGSRLSIFP